jgi:hypothetical protein
MSNVPVVGPVLKGAGKLVGGVAHGLGLGGGGGGGGTPATPADAAAAHADPGKAAQITQTKVFLKNQARGAGATRTTNAADVLGDSTFTGPKAKTAARQLLG